MAEAGDAGKLPRYITAGGLLAGLKHSHKQHGLRERLHWHTGANPLTTACSGPEQNHIWADRGSGGRGVVQKVSSSKCRSVLEPRH